MKRNRRLIPWLISLALALTPACVKTKVAVIKPDTSPVEFTGKCQEGDCENGTGTLLLNGGGKYVGGFMQGKFNGQGALTLANNMSFTGNFR